MLKVFRCILAVVALSACSVYAKTEDYLERLVQLDDNNHLEYVLSNILTPRAVGSEGHERVAAFLKKELESLGLTTEIDQFDATVPLFGNLTFTNVVGFFNPTADEFLALACHYDSKYFADNPQFVGATDSAVPCAIMLNVVKVLLPLLEEHKNRKDIGLMLVFFDGEEAFKEWTEEDSIYGSKHLAKKLTDRKSSLQTRNQVVNDIDRIEVLILLDLIGAKNSKFYNFFPNTAGLHNDLVQIERTLANASLLEGRRYQFMPRTKLSFIDDDHRPFLQRDVPILHLITTPFPPQWHTEEDTAENLHWPSIRNFNKVLRVFVHSYITMHKAETSFRQLGNF